MQEEEEEKGDDVDKIEVDLLDLVEEAVEQAMEEVESVSKETMSQDGAGQDFERDLSVSDKTIYMWN